MVRRRGVRGWFRRHPRWMNTVVVAIYLFSALWVFPTAWSDMGSDALPLLIGYGVIAAALCMRHIRPVMVGALVAVFEAVMLFVYPWQGAQMLGLSFAAYCIAYHHGLRIGILTTVPVSALAYTSLLRLDDWVATYGSSWWMTDFYAGTGMGQWQALWVVAVSCIFTVGISAGIGAAVRRGHQHEREILDWARTSHGLAQVGERNRIAREMHDVVAHSLSVMISLADGARVVMRKNPDRAAEVLEELSGTGRDALADMRRVIGVLREGNSLDGAQTGSELGTALVRESLEELYESFRRAGMPLQVSHSGAPLPHDEAFGLTVHRIIQESLTNVLRYAKEATRVQVSVEHHAAAAPDAAQRASDSGLTPDEQKALGLAGPAQVIITVTDDGAPAADGARRRSMGSGLGISGMQERAAFYHGSVYAGPFKHRGWQVTAVLEPPALRSPPSAGPDGDRADPSSPTTPAQTAEEP